MPRSGTNGATAARMTVGLACGAIIASLAIVTQAHAYDAQAWMRFGSHTGHAQDGGRAFARRWEANPPRGFPTLSKKNLAPMKRAIAQYRAIVKKGGWKRVPRIVLRPGANHDAVVALRRRLFASGDLRSTSLSTHYGYYVEKAVRRFQASNGLSPTGVVDKRTISALNVPAKDRLRQLRVNYSRLRELSRSTAKRYVLVNIPAAQVEAIENDKVASRHAGVVGKIDRKTPTLRSRVHELNFNPVWRLPPTVVKKDLIPKGRSMQRRGKSVLVK
ncbi:MAG: peptidoglycan-binding protein, partial [Pseudomonadota bacterium]